MQKVNLGFESVKMFIADEADTLFDMGFFEDVSFILKACTNPHLNKAYFSATMQPAIEEVLKQDMGDPVKLTVGIKNAANTQIL
jgi:ATP-dependent RNA helicase DDX52/ROK1